MPDIFDQMATAWQAPIVTRAKIKEFTGGAVAPKHMANIDSLGEGPERVVVNGRVCYPVFSFVSWLRARSQQKG